MPKGDFWALAQTVTTLAFGLSPPALVREHAGETRLFFAGDREVVRAVRAMEEQRCPALAVLSIQQGAYAFRVEPFGYEASIDQLLMFFMSVFPLLGECTVYDNLTGADVTRIAERLPPRLFELEGPGDVVIGGG